MEQTFSAAPNNFIMVTIDINRDPDKDNAIVRDKSRDIYQIKVWQNGTVESVGTDETAIIDRNK